MNFIDRVSKSLQISNFMNILLVGAKLFYADGRTDRHDKANSRFSQFLRTRLKWGERV